MGACGAAAHRKKARELNATILTIDECGLLLAPLVRRTLAPRGKTPVHRQRGRHREKVSAIAGLAMSPRRFHLRLLFRTYPRETINNVKVADFLRSVLRQVRGPLIVIWDNGNMHRGDPIRELLSRTDRLHLERLPPYAPDCNPAEFLWRHAKYEKMANFFPNDVDEIDREATRHFKNAAKCQKTMRTFVTQSQLKRVLIRN